MQELDLFTEQAEYIEKDAFEKWTTTHIDEELYIKKLSQGGAKLIVGPRGCGKTTLMLKTYYSCLKTKTTLGVYVNFKSSLKLEPLYKKESSAQYWFNQWMLLKVVEGLLETLDTLNKKRPWKGKYIKKRISRSLNFLEMGRIDLFKSEEAITIEDIVSEIEFSLENSKRKRCVILLDDAAHAFSNQQQQDFFEFFRQIRRKNISPKAAVYPGVTNYSPSFHIGHDAEEIDVWMRPNNDGYIEFMHSILKSRFSENVYSKLTDDISLLNLLCYSAYGSPRLLLNMVARLCKDTSNGDEDIEITEFNSQKVIKSIKDSFRNTYNVYESLRVKLPMYSQFIDVGEKVFENMLTILKDFNRNHRGSPNKQSSIIAIKRHIPSEFEKVLGFFQYAGLISPMAPNNRGEKGVYELFEIHSSAIIDRNVFFSRNAISKEDYCQAFGNKTTRLMPQHSVESIVGSDNVSKIFNLSLPPCSFCKTPRVSENAKFCSHCGAYLTEASVFEDIVQQDIEVLPITKERAATIKKHSKIRTIKDILMDYDNSELQSVTMIGPVWCKKIKSWAEEVIV